MRTRRLTAVFAFAAALAFAGFVVPAAHASTSPKKGCPANKTCGYATNAAFNNNEPTRVFDNYGASLEYLYYGGGGGTMLYWVNNSDAPEYSSEGSFLLEIPGVLCVYLPDPNDEQAPDTTEQITDGVQTTVIALGPTAASVDSPVEVGLADCG